MIEKIDQVEKSLNRLLYQYSTKPTIRGLLEGLTTGQNGIEDLAIALLEEMALDNATGVNLDLLGAVFNVPRRGLNDVDYRNIILAEIYALNSGSTPNDLLQAFSLTIASDLVQIYETNHRGADPAKAGIAANFILKGLVDDFSQIPPTTRQLMQVAAPAGVGRVEVVVSDDPNYWQSAEFVINQGIIRQNNDGATTISDLLFDDMAGDDGKILFQDIGDVVATESSLFAELEPAADSVIATDVWTYSDTNIDTLSGSDIIATTLGDWSEVVSGAVIEITYTVQLPSGVITQVKNVSSVLSVTPTVSGWSIQLDEVMPTHQTSVEYTISQPDVPVDQTGWVFGLGLQLLEVFTNGAPEQFVVSTPVSLLNEAVFLDGIMLEVFDET